MSGQKQASQSSEEDGGYSASEAIARLGIARTKFYELVESGIIPKITARGRKQGRYPKRDIDAMALAVDMALSPEERLVFSKSTPGDQLEEMDIGIRCFGAEYITPLPERIAFQQRSPYTFWSLKVAGKVVGYISMFRFPPEFLDDILVGRRIEREITVKEVLPFERLKPFSVYVDVLAMDPEIPIEQRKFYAGILVSRFANILLDLLANRYQIEAIYTVTATPEGDQLVRDAGFRLLESKSQATGRLAYIFPLDEQGIKLLTHIAQISRRSLR